MSQENREFEVELTVITTHLYVIPARTAEEAEADAENLLDDGDEGEITYQQIESAEAFPIDDLSTEEDDEIEEGILKDE